MTTTPKIDPAEVLIDARARAGARVDADPEILTPEELAGRLKIPVKSIYELTRWRCKDPVPFNRVGRELRFDWGRVVLWWDKRAAKKQARPRRYRRNPEAKSKKETV